MNFVTPKSLKNRRTTFCPGCGHGIIHRLIAEVIDEFNIREKTIGVAPVGCAVFAYDYWDFDVSEAAHGRAPAVATAIKRVLPDRIVFTYQGDGDLAAIGTAEIIHCANRGENITVIFVNNAVYGMTGGQMAPTTLLQQITTTTPFGREAQIHGYPIKISEALAQIEGTRYIERVAVNNIPNIIKAKRAIKKAFSLQIAGKGFSLVEVLSMCPVGWNVSPQEATKLIDGRMVSAYPLGVIKGGD